MQTSIVYGSELMTGNIQGGNNCTYQTTSARQILSVHSDASANIDSTEQVAADLHLVDSWFKPQPAHELS
jgi:hypothetical protein